MYFLNRRQMYPLILGAAVFGLGLKSDDSYATALEWHGFLSTGVVASDSDVAYQSAIDRTPNWGVLSRAGLNASTSLANNLDAVFQVLAEGGSSQYLRPTLVLINFRPFESLSLRLGRQQLPLWLMSDFLYVGHAIPWTIAPDEVYGYNPLDTLEGVNAAHSLSVGPAQVVTEIYGGTSSRKQNEKNNLDVQAKELMGINLKVTNEVFTFRVGYTEADVSIKTEAFTVPEFQVKYFSYGLKVDYRGLLLLGEHSKLAEKRDSNEESAAEAAFVAARSKVQQTGAFEDKIAYQQAEAALGVAQKTVANSTGWYALLGYQWGAWMPNYTYAVWNPSHDHISNSPQKSQTLGVRYELNPRTAFKINMKSVSLKGDESGFFDPVELNAARTRPSNIRIMSSSVDVVF